MGIPDTTAQAELDKPINRPGYIGFLDIVGDPIRVTTAPYNLSFSATGDADLDGQTFLAQDGVWMAVAPVENKEGGVGSVVVTLSGLTGLDDETLALINDAANWQGRRARLWAFMIGPDGAPVGNVWAYYTGWMTVPKISGDRQRQTITMTIEGWQTYFSQASNRSWLSQSLFDPDDHSAELSIAIANGTRALGETAAAARAAAMGPYGQFF